MPVGQFGSGRTLTCVHCHAVVLVCPHCDRGQRYCSARCRDQARRVAQRQAGGRYQSTPRGRSAHALRQQRYRARGEQKKVTHQGSQGRSVVMYWHRSSAWGHWHPYRHPYRHWQRAKSPWRGIATGAHALWQG